MKRKVLLTVAFVSMLLLLPSVAMQFVNFGQANPHFWDGPDISSVEWKEEGEIPPPEGTLPPVISIVSPQNNTSYASNNISLTLSASVSPSNSVNLQISEIYYVPSWHGANNKRIIATPKGSVTQASISLNGVPEGSHWLQVHAVASAVAYVSDRKTEDSTVWDRTKPVPYGAPEPLKLEKTTIYYVSYKITSSSLVKFAIDKTAPRILSVSIENKTYSTSDLPLNIIVNEPASQVIYSLDGQSNMTVAGNTTLNDVSDGEHILTVSVLDSAGNSGSMETAYFSVDVTEPLPTVPVAAATFGAVVAAVSVVAIFKKRKH